MSIFQGRLNEYPFIAIDNFTEETHNCNAFFLSHCHKDHMDGLDSEEFLKILKSCDNISLFCSETTKNLMQNDESLQQLCTYTHGIPVSQPTILKIHRKNLEEQLSMVVTLIPAGHCVGSVMFLFEGSKGAVLYTGDYRIGKGDIQKVPCLKSNQRVKEIKALYIDTTFCTPSVQTLPQREETLQTMVGLIKSWLDKADNFVVFIQCSAKYGYEYLFKEIAIKFKTKIHVDSYKMNLYSAVSGMKEFCTTDGKSTRIHSCRFNVKHSRSCLPCGISQIDGKPLHVMRLKPSTLWFTKKRFIPADNISYDKRNDTYRIVHSMHASYEEIIDVVSYLKPCYVYPCVTPVDTDDVIHAYDRLKGLLSDAKSASQDQEEAQINEDLRETENALLSNNWRLSLHREAALSPKRAKAFYNNLGIQDETLSPPMMTSGRKHKRRQDQNEAETAQVMTSFDGEEEYLQERKKVEVFAEETEKEGDVRSCEWKLEYSNESSDEDPKSNTFSSNILSSERNSNGNSNCFELENNEVKPKEFDIPISPGCSEPSDRNLADLFVSLSKGENVLNS